MTLRHGHLGRLIFLGSAACLKIAAGGPSRSPGGQADLGRGHVDWTATSVGTGWGFPRLGASSPDVRGADGFGRPDRLEKGIYQGEIVVVDTTPEGSTVVLPVTFHYGSGPSMRSAGGRGDEGGAKGAAALPGRGSRPIRGSGPPSRAGRRASPTVDSHAGDSGVPGRGPVPLAQTTADRWERSRRLPASRRGEESPSFPASRRRAKASASSPAGPTRSLPGRPGRSSRRAVISTASPFRLLWSDRPFHDQHGSCRDHEQARSPS